MPVPPTCPPGLFPKKPGLKFEAVWFRLAAMSTVTEIKTAFQRLPQKDRWKLAEWIQEKMESPAEDPVLESALRHSLNSPLKKFKPGHFAALANRRPSRVTA